MGEQVGVIVSKQIELAARGQEFEAPVGEFQASFADQQQAQFIP
jgi:hypothetical protein